jgi:hypothetical protein
MVHFEMEMEDTVSGSAFRRRQGAVPKLDGHRMEMQRPARMFLGGGGGRREVLMHLMLLDANGRDQWRTAHWLVPASLPLKITRGSSQLGDVVRPTRRR